MGTLLVKNLNKSCKLDVYAYQYNSFYCEKDKKKLFFDILKKFTKMFIARLPTILSFTNYELSSEIGSTSITSMCFILAW